MDIDKILTLTAGICFCFLVLCCSKCQRDIDTEAIKAGLHQAPGTQSWVK